MALGKLKKLFNPEEGEQNEEYYSSNSEETVKRATDAGNSMILVEPRAYSESQQIADHLKNRNTVLVNLKRVTPDQAKRIIDFLIYSFVFPYSREIFKGVKFSNKHNINADKKVIKTPRKLFYYNIFRKNKKGHCLINL